MAQFFTRPNFENRQIVQRTTDTISLSGTTAIANPGYLQINQGAAPGLVATSLDFDGTVIWGPISGLSWSISACTSPFYTNNIVACPSSAGTIVIDSGILTLNGALQINTVFSAGTASDRLLVVDSNGFVKIGQTGTSISSLSYSNNNLILTLNDGSVFTATINSMTGLTINGNLNVSGNTSIIGNLNITGNTYVNGIVSATTFYGSGAGLTGIPDYYVTGGTYNSTTGTLTLNRQNGSITVTGFTSGTGGTGFTDNYVTGGSYSYSTGTLTLNRQNGSVSIPGIQFTGNTLATCITDIYVQNLYGCNPITIQSSLKSAAGGSTAAGTLSFALGNNVTAAGNFSVAQGNATSTAGGTYAHAEGFNTLASGQGSHAEGRGSIASGNYSHAQGLFTNATTEGTFASGSGSTASGANSFVHSVGSTVSGNRSVVLGGFGINGTANDFVYVPSLNINTTPTNNNSNTQILSRNSGTGNIEYTDSSLLTFDTYVTGFTYNNANQLKISRNQGQPDLIQYINVFTGITVNGSISATTYLNLPRFVTGATYSASAGTLTLTTNYGTNINLTGFTSTDSFVTGYTFTNGNTLTITQNNGKTVPAVTINNLTLTGLTVNGSISASTYLNLPRFVTGGTYSAGTLTLNTNYGTNINVTGFTSVDTYVTGFTYNNSNRLTLSQNQGQPDLNLYINVMSGLTVAGSISASTYLNLPAFITGYTDSYVTGFTFTNNNTLTISRNQGLGNLPVTINNLTLTGLTVNGAVSASTYLNLPQFVTGGTYSAGTLSLLTNYGNSINLNITGFSTTDTYVTGFTLTNGNTLNITQNNGQTVPSVVLNNLTLTGLTINGAISASTYLNLPAFITGFTDTFVTGFTYNNTNKLTIGRNQGQPDLNVFINIMSGLTINGSISASTYLNLPQFVTGGTYSAGTITLNTNYGNNINLNVTGFSTTDTYVTGFTLTNGNTLNITQNNGQPVPSVTINNLTLTGLTINGAISASTYLNLPAFITGYTDSFTTGFTFTNNNTLTISRNQGLSDLPVTINNLTLTGLTVNGSISASTYLNLPPFTGNTSASCITDLYVSNIYGCSPITVHDSIKSVGSTVSGSNSFAFGEMVTATGPWSMASGRLTQSTAMGSNAEGTATTASGNYSHAEGGSTITIGVGSHAEGGGTQAIGNYSHAEGDTTYSGAYAYSISGISGNDIVLNPSYGDVTFEFTSSTVFVYDGGIGAIVLNFSATSYNNITSATTVTVSNNIGSLLVPYYILPNPVDTGIYAPTKADQLVGGGSHAEGNITQSIGLSSHAEGTGTQSIGDDSHAEGSGTQAIGAVSHAEGLGTQAIGRYSHAEGLGTKAIGYGSHSQGFNTITSGIYSFASGSGSTASGIASFIHSSRSVVTGDRSVVLGGVGITGTSNDFVYVPSLNINSTPTNNNSATQVLVRNSSTGDVEYRNASTIGGGGTVTADTYVTGFTYNNANVLSITQNNGQTVPTVKIDRFTGLTITNGLSADTLTLTTMPVTNSTSTQALVRNTTTGNVETKTFGLDNIVLTIAPPAIPIAGVGPSVDTIKGIPQGQVITGYTTIYVNNVSQAGPSVTTNFGTYNNTTGLFTTNVNATLMLNAWIHLKPDTSTSTAWSLSGTGEFGLGICPNNTTDIYVGDYQVVIPDPDTAQYVYELYGANAPRTNQIDISTSTVIYANSGATFRVKVLNKTDRNYAGSTVVTGDGIRFSITRIM